MKKKITILFALLAVFSLAIAAYAYTRTTVVEKAAACCCKGDSCPMKGKKEHGDHAKTAEHNCCGDSCPMKKGDGQAAGDHKCCGDSCPMNKKDGKGAAEDGKGCCDCCKGEAKTEKPA